MDNKNIIYAFKKCISILLILNILSAYNGICATASEYEYGNIYACWISYLDIEKYLKDTDEETFRTKVAYMYDNLLAYDINTVIVQVRPMGDAIYPSEYFPVSRYINSDRDILPYDPLEIMIELAHQRELRFEAWINPYRLSKNKETTEYYKSVESYDKYKEIIYIYYNSAGEECMSLDPVRQDSIDLITAGVREVVENYDVDGVHFDDYFFVEGMYDDMPIEEKMLYVNSMVSQVYEAIKEIDADCEFGISPSGNIELARTQGVDVDRWLTTPGYIDYLMPQIYWTDNYKYEDGMVTMFSNMATAWQEVNMLDMPIYVGLALYRVGEESEIDLGWSKAEDNMSRSWQTAYDKGYDGYALFRYEWFEMETACKELDNLMNKRKMLIQEKNSSLFSTILGIGAGYIKK